MSKYKDLVHLYTFIEKHMHDDSSSMLSNELKEELKYLLLIYEEYHGNKKNTLLIQQINDQDTLLEQAKEEIGEKKRAINFLQKKLEDYEAMLNDKENRINSINVTQSAYIDEINLELNQLRERYNQEVKEKRRLNELVERRESEIRKEGEEKVILVRELGDLKKDNFKFKNQLEEAQCGQIKLQEHMNNELERISHEMRALNEEKDSLADQLCVLTKEQEESRRQLKQLMIDNKRLEEYLKDREIKLLTQQHTNTELLSSIFKKMKEMNVNSQKLIKIIDHFGIEGVIKKSRTSLTAESGPTLENLQDYAKNLEVYKDGGLSDIQDNISIEYYLEDNISTHPDLPQKGHDKEEGEVLRTEDSQKTFKIRFSEKPISEQTGSNMLHQSFEEFINSSDVATLKSKIKTKEFSKVVKMISEFLDSKDNPSSCKFSNNEMKQALYTFSKSQNKTLEESFILVSELFINFIFYLEMNIKKILDNSSLQEIHNERLRIDKDKLITIIKSKDGRYADLMNDTLKTISIKKKVYIRRQIEKECLIREERESIVEREANPGEGFVGKVTSLFRL